VKDIEFESPGNSASYHKRNVCCLNSSLWQKENEIFNSLRVFQKKKKLLRKKIQRSAGSKKKE
jgi:hypothetical protein